MPTPYGNITADVLSVIKAPSLYEPEINLNDDSNTKYNNINGRLFQFRTRFIYDDDEKSVFSPISPVYILVNYQTVYGHNSPAGIAHNRFIIQVDIPNDPTINKMEIAVREGNNGIWYLADIADVSGSRGATYSYDFYNDKILSALDQADVNRPYDYVPKLAGVQEIIDGNRLIYGDVTEGYDNDITLDVDLSLGYDSYSTAVGTLSAVRKTSSLHYIVDLSFVTAFPHTPEIVIIGDYIVNRYTYPHTFFWDEDAGGSESVGATKIADQFVADMANDPVIESAYRDGDNLHIVFHNYIEFAEVLYVVGGDIYAYKSLKDGATQYLGIVYADKYGRHAPVKRSANDTEIYIPFTTQTGGPGNRQYISIDYQINHTPPSWAHTWRWVYGGSSISWFQRFVIRTHDFNDKSIWREDGYMKIKINQGINDVRDVLNNFIYPNYIWQKGDRLRVIGTREVTGLSDVNDQTVTILSEYIDLDILNFDGIYLYVSDWMNAGQDPDVDNIDKDIIIEIYRPRKDADENRLYYGIGQVNEITNPGEPSRSHYNGNGTLPIAECYAYEMPLVALFGEETFRTPIDITTTTSTTTSTTFTTDIAEEFSSHYGIRSFPVLTRYQNPFKENSDVFDIGEVHIIDPDYKQQRLNNLRYSGPFIARTKINQLNRFDYDAVREMEDRYGRIYGLKQVGHTLKVLQTKKNTSIYLGREYYVDAQGNQQLILTDNVLGSKTEHPEDYGTIFPCSLVKADRSIFYYDIYSAKIIRDDPNGQKVISLDGIDSYLRTKSRVLLNSGIGNVDVIAGVDQKNGIVYFTFTDSNDSGNNETISYHIWDQRWLGNHSFIPELYSSMGDNMFVSFKSGELWKHNSDAVNKNSFYGIAYSSEIHLVSNINPQVMKQWDSIEVASNKLWTIADDDSIVIDASTRHPGGMQSKILSGDWEEYEEVFRAAFNFDMLTGDNATANNYYLHNGRELRGRNMLIKLKNSDTSEVNLVLVKIYSKASQ